MAQYFGVGKSTVIKVLKSGVELQKLGVLTEDIGDIIEEATAFMAACYGVQSLVTSNMSEVRGEIWSRRMGRKNVSKAPELKSLHLLNIGVGTGGPGGPGPLTFLFEGAQYDRAPPLLKKYRPIFELKVTPYFQSIAGADFYIQVLGQTFHDD